MPKKHAQAPAKRRIDDDGVGTSGWVKDDEEEDLEAKLFGAARPKKAKKAKAPVAEGGEDEGETGLGWMQDDELFTVDAGLAPADMSDAGEVSEDDAEPVFEFVAEDDDDGEDDEDEQAAGGARQESLWHDPADDAVTASLVEDKRLRKLARGKDKVDGEVVGGRELQRRLREQYERVHPRPAWVDQRVRAASSLSALLSSTASFLAPSTGDGAARPALPAGTLDIQRMRNANEHNPTTGKGAAKGVDAGVVSFDWHPSARVSVLAVAGGDRRVRFFNVDGHTNAALVTLHIPSLPLSRTTFHPSGSSVLITGPRPYYYTYDLAAQRCVRSPRTLFGSVPSPSSPQTLARHAFSPDGALLAVAGRRGAVSIVEWLGGGAAGAVVAELKSGRGGAVADLAWSADGRELTVLGGRDGAEAEVWDVPARRVVRKWADPGAFGGLIMRASAAGEHVAVGSSTGIVNLYAASSLTGNALDLKPTPAKSLEHLTTPISALAFHPAGQMLVSASSAKRDALRVYHLPSATAFANWPTPSTPLGRVTAAGFSSSGEYLTVGNTKGAVLLWSLKHYAA
ncbi:U3 snoRNP protein [Cryptotrichosporon argae]